MITLDDLLYIFGPAILYGVIGAAIIIGILSFLRSFELPSERAEKRWAARQPNVVASVPGEFIILKNVPGESRHAHVIDGIPKEIAEEAMRSGAANGYWYNSEGGKRAREYYEYPIMFYEDGTPVGDVKIDDPDTWPERKGPKRWSDQDE